MQYKVFPKINEKVSLLGMGCMRFPLNEDESVDEAQSIDMIRSAIDSGVNYVDTAYTYHQGDSEKIVGKALKDGYREKVLLADKMPIWLAKDKEDVKRIFDTQFQRLQVDCVDMYLVHNLSTPLWKRTKKLEALPFLEEMRAQGKIRYIGFSFHDTFDCFKEIVDAYEWDFCQIQMNYMDQNFQAGVKGLEYAASKGLGVISMESLKGGRLVAAIPPSVQKIFDACPIKKSPAEWAFKWLANRPEITLMLSGMGRKSELEENIEILSKENVAELTAEEAALIDDVAAEYNRLIPYPCTSCQYCMPCPQKLEIYKIINYYNDWNVYEQNPNTAFEYNNWLVKHGSDCIGCKACEEKCPQHLNISEAMQKAAGIFGR